MKHLLLLSAAFFCTTAFAQSVNEQQENSLLSGPRKAEQNDGVIYLNDKITSYDANNVATQRAEYTFDDNGYVVSSTIFKKSGSRLVEHSKSEYTNDAEGKFVEILTYLQNDGVWTLYSKAKYSYDNAGKVCNEDTYVLIDGEWILSSSWNYDRVYDEHGNAIKYKLTVLENGEWQTWADSKYDLEYNDEGLLKTELEYVNIEDEWVLNAKREYAYNPKGYLTSQFTYYWVDGNWRNGGKIVYTRDSHGNITKRTSYSYSLTYNSYAVSSSTAYHYIAFTTPVESVSAAPVDAATRKLLKDGRLFIQYGNHRYGMGGQRIE